MKQMLILLIVVLLALTLNHTSCADPALKIKLNPPEENSKDTIEALKDIDKLENDLRLGSNDDYDEEKKKLIEIQKARVHDIVHGAFIALQALIPNPIKASIRKGIRDHINGKSPKSTGINTKKSEDSTDTKKTDSAILSLQQNINKLSSFKEKNVKIYDEQDNQKQPQPRFNLRSSNEYMNMNQGNVESQETPMKYPEDNTELYKTNFPMMRPI